MFRWGFQRQSFSRSVFLLCAERQIRKTDSSDAFGVVFLFPSPGLHVTQLNVDSVFCVSRYFVNGQWGHFLHFWLAGNVLRRRPKQMSFTGKPSCFRSILKLEASSAPSGWFVRCWCGPRRSGDSWAVLLFMQAKTHSTFRMKRSSSLL